MANKRKAERHLTAEWDKDASLRMPQSKPGSASSSYIGFERSNKSVMMWPGTSSPKKFKHCLAGSKMTPPTERLSRFLARTIVKTSHVEWRTVRTSPNVCFFLTVCQIKLSGAVLCTDAKR